MKSLIIEVTEESICAALSISWAAASKSQISADHWDIIADEISGIGNVLLYSTEDAADADELRESVHLLWIIAFDRHTEAKRTSQVSYLVEKYREAS